MVLTILFYKAIILCMLYRMGEIKSPNVSSLRITKLCDLWLSFKLLEYFNSFFIIILKGQIYSVNKIRPKISCETKSMYFWTRQTKNYVHLYMY